MPPAPESTAFGEFLASADRLEFPDHQIGDQLRADGHHGLDLPDGFPFAVVPFQFSEGKVTKRLSWHERLELLVPLDGPLSERMGDAVTDLGPGDVLVVDHLKPHQVVDRAGLDTRAVVVTFLPECVFGPGSPAVDYAFLLPFHHRDGSWAQVMRASSPRAPEVHRALARLLGAAFGGGGVHRELACKAWLLVLLEVLAREFRSPAFARAALVRHGEQVGRLKPVFDHVRSHYTERLSLGDACAMCGMSPATFERVFKRTLGMTFRAYLNHVRMSHAVELLEGTGDPIVEIAARLGFSDQSHFDRRFRQAFGRTPSDHRARMGNGR